MRHHPGKRHWDGPEHDWADARNRRDQEHYLGTKDAPDDAICRGHFYLHKIKDVDGIPERLGPGRRGAPRREAARLRAAAPVGTPARGPPPELLARVLGARRGDRAALPAPTYAADPPAPGRALPWPRCKLARLSNMLCHDSE